MALTTLGKDFIKKKFYQERKIVTISKDNFKYNSAKQTRNRKQNEKDKTGSRKYKKRKFKQPENFILRPNQKKKF